MRVILKQDVPNLGRAGDIREVKNGYGRNYLIPNGLVMPATARSEKERIFLEKVQEKKIQKRKKTAEETAQTIRGKEVRITMKTGEEGKLFGSVTSIVVQKALEKEGYLIDKKLIQVDEPIKQLGKYTIPLKFYEGIESEITIFVQDEDGNIEPVIEEKETEDAAPEEVSQESETATEEAVVSEEE